MFGYVDLFEEAYGMDSSAFYKREVARGRDPGEVLDELDRMADRAWREKQKLHQSDGWQDADMDEIPEALL